MSAKVQKTETIRDQPGGADSPSEIPGVVILFSEVPVAGEGLYAGRPEMTVGRSPEAFIFIEDTGLSRKHLIIRYGPGGIRLDDQQSHNGSFLNGVRIAGTAGAGPGDVLRCGRNILLFVKDIRPYKGWTQWGMELPLVGGPVMRALREEIAAFATSELEVLLLGQSGTGKELVAQELHRQSGRTGALVAVNCAAIAGPLFEAELFGVIRGAFTGAVASRGGLFQSAQGGTLFLDEVAELSPALQAKLLRSVEQKEIRPVGSQRPVTVDVRLVAATNRDLGAEVRRGDFREDLYHRLYGARVLIPALRERKEDIPLLAKHLIGRHANGRLPIMTSTCMERLLCYDWPGNVRELDRTLHEALARAVARGDQRLLPEHLRNELTRQGTGENPQRVSVREALTQEGGNVSRAAASLGMSRARIYNLLKEQGLDPDDFR